MPSYSYVERYKGVLNGDISSTSTSTGTLVVTGGAGISGNLNVSSINLNSGNITNAGTIQMGTQTNKATLTYTTNTARTYTIPDAGANANFVMTEGAQTINGNKTFGGIVSAASIQNTPIGSTTRSTGAFTTLTANNSVTFTQNTASTSTTTGTLVVTGGVGIGGRASVNDLFVNNVFNTGVSLSANSWSSGRISIRSALVNLKTVATTQIFTVPSGYMFLIDTMEIVTTAITTPGNPPTISFGTVSSTSEYYGPTQITSNSVGARHIIENPQDGATSSTVVTFSVTTASTASVHTGCGIVTGYLLKTS
jgi:hypothetical protein